MRARAIVAAGFFTLLLLFGGVTTAQADTYPVSPPPSVLSISATPPAVDPVAVAPVEVEAKTVTRGGLALTGADIIEMVMVGVGLVLVGLVVRQAGRRSPAV